MKDPKTVTTIQVFKCCVHSFDETEDVVNVSMKDLTNPDNPEEMADMKLSNIPKQYRQFGRTFDMKLTLEFTDHKWTQEEIDRIESYSKEINELFGETHEPQS